MEKDIRQIVVQITSSKYARGVVQYEADSEETENKQKIIKYDDLDSQEKSIWDDFVNLLKDKE